MEAGAMTKRPQLELKRRDDQDGGKLATRRRGPTGPRTELGKQRSKLNAVKYGIFSSVLLLGTESHQEFDRLVSGLQDHYQPVGTLEEALVDHLAASLWRLRRLLTAEAAEIARSLPAAEFHPDDLIHRTVVSKMFNSGQGLLSTAFLTRDLSDLLSAVSVMRQLGDRIRKEGLSWQRDRDSLEEVFGRSNEIGAAETNQEEDADDVVEEQAETSVRMTTSASSRSFINRYKKAAERYEQHGKGAAQAAVAIVDEINSFVKSMNQECKRWLEKDDIDRLLKREAALIPKPEVAEKLLRYQITLERSVERTMTHLDRLQQMRLGQPVARPIELDRAG